MIPIDLQKKAESLGISLTAPPDPPFLRFHNGRLELHFDKSKQWRPFQLDFGSPEYLHPRRRLSKKNNLLKAVGQKESGRRIFDATAGWGSDSLRLALSGYKVQAMEKHPIVHLMSWEALRHAQKERPEAFQSLALEFLHGDSMLDMSEISADVIFLDPMFTPKRKGLSPKSMQVLQMLHGPCAGADELLRKALQQNVSRVVIKRPLKQQLTGPLPNHSIKGQSIRYDIYLIDRDTAYRP